MGDLLERDCIVGQSLFCDQISHENHQQIVGDPLGHIPVLREIVSPIFGGQVGQIVGRLPGLFNGGEQKEILPDKLLQAFDHFHSRMPFCLDHTRSIAFHSSGQRQNGGRTGPNRIGDCSSSDTN